MTKSLLVLAVSSAFVCSSALAGIVTTYNLVGTTGGATSQTETRAYAGLKWSVEGGATPSLVLGAMRARISSGGNTEGANLALSINLAGGVKPASIKLGYLNGKEDFQGELGVGYNFLKATPLVGFGVNAPYANLGADWSYGNGFDPFAIIHTHGKFGKPAAASTQTCTPVSGFTGAFTDAACTNPNIL
ncbi:hypothetical protein SKTS_28930 [Sulfurimicrobium lacus]|uniref:Porin domain-containing protein n=1 Tax=Sulfurimicrobium lacus TaxID=2715678 RepID=A0A6F8VFX8_9PROT|nr:hypothetical protein [Sulfurimicrobium lacus]BCB28007.1 hypothetical protein SKTS_28930 [Sulfurimicrobium lacus]